MSMVSAKRLVGRTIVAFDPNASKDGPNGATVHDPVLHLDDGTRLRFIVEETEEGANYGVLIIAQRPKDTATKTVVVTDEHQRAAQELLNREYAPSGHPADPGRAFTVTFTTAPYGMQVRELALFLAIRDQNTRDSH